MVCLLGNSLPCSYVFMLTAPLSMVSSLPSLVSTGSSIVLYCPFHLRLPGSMILEWFLCTPVAVVG